MSKPKKLTERQRFEAWYRRAYNWIPIPKTNGSYEPNSASVTWEAWQASARAKR